MSTGIVWTDRTWNPVTGCDRVSEGCDNCYALTMAGRLKAMRQQKYQRDGDPRTSGPGFAVTVHPTAVNEPLRWRRPSMVFVNSMSDLFHADVPSQWLVDIFAVMAAAQQHTFQVLTKRHGRMRSLLNDDVWIRQVFDRATELGANAGKGLARSQWTWPLPNVWLGVSAETQAWADVRIPALLATPAAVRWVSAEPLLGPIDLNLWMRPKPGCGHVSTIGDGCCWHPDAPNPECHSGVNCPVTDIWQGLDWVVVGGESGPGAREMQLPWAGQIVRQCQGAGVPVLVKQLGTVTGGREHQDIDIFPAALRVREYPRAAS